MNLEPRWSLPARLLDPCSRLRWLQGDTNGYIGRLQQDGVPMLSGTVPAVQAGMTACAMIRDGVPPQDVAGQIAGLWSGVLGPRIVAAAQDELCPDTLN